MYTENGTHNMKTIGRCEERKNFIVERGKVYIVGIFFRKPETLHMLTF